MEKQTDEQEPKRTEPQTKPQSKPQSKDQSKLPEDRYMRRAKTTLNIQTWISVIVCVAAIAWGILYAIIH